MENTTKLQQYEQIQPMVQKEIESQFEKLYKQYATKYGVSSTPLHYHNGKDAPNVPATNVAGIEALSASGNGVLAPQNIVDRTVIWNQAVFEGGAGEPATFGNPPTVPVLPLLVISGDTGFESLPFLGGEAPDGTIIYYKTADQWQLWVRLFGYWQGVNMTEITAQ